jgi:hypothetical protein
MRKATLITLELILCAIVAALFWFAATAKAGRCLDPEPICPAGTEPVCMCSDPDDPDDCWWVCAWIDR